MLTKLQWDIKVGWTAFTSQLAQQLLDQCYAQAEFGARTSSHNQFWVPVEAKGNWAQVKNHLLSALRELG